MRITASSYHDLEEIVNLLEDKGYLSAQEANTFDSFPPPTEIVVQATHEQLDALLKDHLGSQEYPYANYGLST